MIEYTRVHRFDPPLVVGEVVAVLREKGLASEKWKIVTDTEHDGFASALSLTSDDLGNSRLRMAVVLEVLL